MAVPDDILRALGRVVVNFSGVELWVTWLTSELISQDQTIGQIVTSEMSFKNIRAALRSILRSKLPNEKELLAKLDKLLGQAKNLEDQRNQIMHCTWMNDEQGAMGRLKITAKEDKGLRHSTSPVSAAEINELADKMKVLGEEFGPFIYDVAKRIPMHVTEGPPPTPLKP